jgi:hypothetical protein
MTSAKPQPRSVQVAYWAWLVAAILLVAAGLLAVFSGAESMAGRFPGASLSQDQARSMAVLVRGVGMVSILLGLAVGYLAGRTRRGDMRFRRATVALSYTIVLMLALFALLFGILLTPQIGAIIALLVAAVAANRDTASAWFAAVDTGEQQ